LGQLAHRILDFDVAHLDVALACRAYIAVTHYPLDDKINRFPVPSNCSLDAAHGPACNHSPERGQVHRGIGKVE